MWLVLISSVLCGASLAVSGNDPVANDETDQVFDPYYVHDIYIYIDPDVWQAMRDKKLRDVWQPVTFIFDGVVQLDEVGIETGNRRNDPLFTMYPNLHVNFGKYRRDQRLFGLQHMTIKGWCCDDDSLITERLSMGLFAAFGLPAQRTAFARLTVNDEYIGPYRIQDRVKKQMVSRFFESDRGNLYKLENTAGYRSRNPDAFWRDPQNPSDPRSYIPFPFKPVSPDNPDGRDIVDMVWALNQATPVAVRLAVSPLLDLDSLIDYLAVDMSLADTDGLVSYARGTPRQYFQNNIFLYNDPTTNRFFIIPDDLDGTFSAFDPASVSRSLTDGWDRMRITKWLLADPELMRRYYDRVRTFLNEWYVPNDLIQQINEMADLIRDAVREDLSRTTMPPRPMTLAQWEARVNVLRQYVRDRAANLRRILSGP